MSDQEVEGALPDTGNADDRGEPIAGAAAEEADARQEAADAAGDRATEYDNEFINDTEEGADIPKPETLRRAIRELQSENPLVAGMVNNWLRVADTAVEEAQNLPADTAQALYRFGRGIGGVKRNRSGSSGAQRITAQNRSRRLFSTNPVPDMNEVEDVEGADDEATDDNDQPPQQRQRTQPPMRQQAGADELTQPQATDDTAPLTEAQSTAQMDAAITQKRRVTPESISTKKQRIAESMGAQARHDELTQPQATDDTEARTESLPEATSENVPPTGEGYFGSWHPDFIRLTRQGNINLALPPDEESRKRKPDTENEEDIKRLMTEDSPEVVKLSENMVFRELPQNQVGVDPDFFKSKGLETQRELYSKLLKTRSVVFGVPYKYTAQTFNNMTTPERYEILQNLATTEPKYEKINNLLNIQYFKDYAGEAKQVTDKLISGLREQYDKDMSERTERARIAEEQKQEKADQINKLNKDLEAARTQLEKYEKSGSDMQGEISELQKKNIKLGKDMIKLGQDKLRTEQTKYRLRQRIRETEDANRARIEMLRQEINNLRESQQAYAGLEAQIGEYKKQENEDKILIDKLDAKLADAREQIRGLQEARESVDNLQQEMRQDERRETSLPGGEIPSFPTNLENATPEQIAALNNQFTIYTRAARLENARRNYENALEARQRGVPVAVIVKEKERRLREEFEASRAQPMAQDDTAARLATAEHIRAGIALADAEADKVLSERARQANMTISEYKRWKDKQERRTRMDEDFDRNKLFEMAERLLKTEREKKRAEERVEQVRLGWGQTPWARRGGGGGRAAGRSRKRTWGGISKGFSLHDLTGIPSIHAETKDDAVLNITARRLFSTLRPTMNRYRTVPGAPYTADMLARAYAESSLPSLSGTKAKKRKYKFRKDRGIDPILRDWNLARPKALREYMQQQSQRR